MAVQRECVYYQVLCLVHQLLHVCVWQGSCWAGKARVGHCRVHSGEGREERSRMACKDSANVSGEVCLFGNVLLGLQGRKITWQ